MDNRQSQNLKKAIELVRKTYGDNVAIEFAKLANPVTFEGTHGHPSIYTSDVVKILDELKGLINKTNPGLQDADAS